jgi:hypothetical protein
MNRSAYDFEGKRYDVGEKIGFIKTTIEFALQDEYLKRVLLEYMGRKGIGSENRVSGTNERQSSDFVRVENTILPLDLFAFHMYKMVSTVKE